MDRRHLIGRAAVHRPAAVRLLAGAAALTLTLAAGCSRAPAATDVATKLGIDLKSAPVDVTTADPTIRREGISSRASATAGDGTTFFIEVYRTAGARAKSRDILSNSVFRQIFVECGRILVFFPGDDPPMKPLAAKARKNLTQKYAPC